MQQVSDTALDQKGFIIVLDDNDLVQIVKYRQKSQSSKLFEFLKARFDELT